MIEDNLYSSNKRLYTTHCPYCNHLFVVENENGRPPSYVWCRTCSKLVPCLIK